MFHLIQKVLEFARKGSGKSWKSRGILHPVKSGNLVYAFKGGEGEHFALSHSAAMRSTLTNCFNRFCKSWKYSRHCIRARKRRSGSIRACIHQVHQ